MKATRTKTCAGCIWGDECRETARCEYYDDGGARFDVETYELILRENAEEYNEMIMEYSDGNVD